MGTPDEPDDSDKKGKEGALDHEPAIATEPGPAAPVAAEVAEEIAADERPASLLPEARAIAVSDERASQPKLRDSMATFGDDVPLTFPDDGPLAKQLRKIDHWVGAGEQIVLFALLAIVVLAGAFQGISGKLAGKTYTWTYELVRDGVLGIAMIGAAFASHQQRHLSMDLISRRLPPRGRLVLRIFLAIVTILVTALLARSCYHLFLEVKGETHANMIIPSGVVSFTLPLGTGLIIFHTLLHLAIDVDYFARGKLPPERARSAH